MAQLRCYMNLLALKGDWREFSTLIEDLQAVGFSGVQFASVGSSEELQICRAHGMGIAASGRIDNPADSGLLAEKIVGEGYECATVHVGCGLEDDAEAARLIESVLEASGRWRVPLYIETHRATICQDMWRTVQFAERFPDMRFNGDFSHWYAGQEMVYGGFEKKLRFIQPVLERVRFLHGRIANPGCIQVPVLAGATYVEHFKQLWTASFDAFLRSGEGSYICFSPELLGPDIYYARTVAGVEESDRWQQSIVLKKIAEQCFASAQLSQSHSTGLLPTSRPCSGETLQGGEPNQGKSKDVAGKHRSDQA